MTLAFQKEISALFRTHPLVLGYNHAKQALSALGPRGQTETSLKIENLRHNKTTGKLL
jgi:hypothetical protein